jgi:hypothetical protein
MKEMMFLFDHFITAMAGKQHVCTWLNQDDQLGLFPTLCFALSSKF